MHVFCITATHGRLTLLNRSVKFFIDQDYTGEHTLLIYNNAPVNLELSSIQLPENKHITLVNRYRDTQTGKEYTSLGAIYNDALNYIPQTCDAVCHTDDDDIFLPNHITEGVNGLKRGHKKGYKPHSSWFRSPDGVTPVVNTLEPSIFVKISHLRKYGYSLVTTEQHLQWVNPLLSEKELYIDKNGPKTLIYNWGDKGILTYKTSGDMHNPENFKNCRKYSQDFGDLIIRPWTDEKIKPYYQLVDGL